MSKEAMQQALEALEWMVANSYWLDGLNNARASITALREALAEQPAQQDSTCSNALRAQGKAYPRTCKKCGLGPCVGLAQQALDKMAENARELGLDYEPAQQEPVAWYRDEDGIRIYYESKVWDDATPLYTSPPAQQEPAGWRPATFHRDNLTFNPGLPDEQTVKFWKLQGVEIEYCYTSPPAQRTWVGLTDEEFDDLRDNNLGISPLISAVEAKLKEKNT